MAALAIAAVSCKKAEPVTPSITLSTPTEVTVPTDGGIQTVSFTTNVPWKASIDNSNWTVSPTSGDAGTASLKVTAINNTSNDPVVAKVTIKAETASQTVTFTQLQKDALVADVTSYDAPAEGGTVSVKVNTNVEVTATTDAEWITIPTPTKGLVEKTFDLTVAANDGEAREGTVILSGAGQKVEITVKQAAFVAEFEVDCDWFEVTKEGGEFTVNITTNVDFTVKDYSDSSFPWQKATLSEDKKSCKVVIGANPAYTPRQSYVKFTVPAIQDPVLDDAGEPTGEFTDHVVRVYFTQKGTAALAWQKSLTAYGNVTTVGGVHRLLIADGQPVLSDGTKFHMIDPANGNILASQELVAPNAASDDAGNLIFGGETPYGETLTLYYALPDGSDPKVLLTYEHTSVYSSLLSNIRVKGDITGDALIVAFTDLYVYAVCWEIKAGVVQNPVLVPLPTEANWETWTGIVWNATRNGCVVPVSASLADGLLYIAYDGRYVLTHVADNGTATPVYSPYAVPAEEGGNENFNCISTTIWNGAYMVAFEQGQFFSWGTCPDFCLLNQGTSQVDNFEHGLLGVQTNYLGQNDGENASSDILLNVDGNGNLEVYVVDALADVFYKVVVPKAN